MTSLPDKWIGGRVTTTRYQEFWERQDIKFRNFWIGLIGAGAVLGGVLYYLTIK
ncbi:MAG: hypothetical protein G01um101416_1244 [Microgenomates group bacterium Gr01-1014_16]|nr:MAG: hypothetical protein G01um101416_1244 [Microgenomates group bacterium Gr01-1014_16]